jgi:hypothetical protein
MRGLWKPLGTVVLAVATITVANAPLATASVGVSSTKEFCKKANAANKTDLTSPEVTTQAAATKAVKDFTTLAKLAPTKTVKKLVDKLRAIYADVAKNGSPDVPPAGYIQASGGFSGYLAGACSS